MNFAMVTIGSCFSDLFNIYSLFEKKITSSHIILIFFQFRYDSTQIHNQFYISDIKNIAYLFIMGYGLFFLTYFSFFVYYAV